MDPESRRLAFEPFLPSREAGKGADLGLAAVFGVLQLSGGAISCDSELGHGTRFTALLPAATASERVKAPRGAGLGSVPKGTSEVVLLVEDDDGVRGLTRRVLERSGYVVLDAKDGREGLSFFESGNERIDILVTDVLMPEMSGGVLAARAKALRPTLRILFVSGHAQDVLVKEGVTKGMAFLQKPYAPAELARKVRDVLDS
jgi:CheY-like chemotaxis protein